MSSTTRFAALALFASALLLPSASSALTLDDLNNGAILPTNDGSLTFVNWSVTTPNPYEGSPNSLVGLDLTRFEVELAEDGLLLKVIETDAPLVAFGGAVGNLRISFDVVTDGFTFITGVGLVMTGTSSGNGAVSSITETITGSSEMVTLEATREAGGTQSPSDSVFFATPQEDLSVVKSIVVDTRGPDALLAQISEFEQSFTVVPIPEPGALLLFAVGGLLVHSSLRRHLVA